MRLIILGAGGHGQVIADMAKDLNRYQNESGKHEIYFLDDRFDTVGTVPQHYGSISYALCGNCDSYTRWIDGQTEFYPAFGHNALRLDWEEKIKRGGGKIATLIHPSAYIAESVVLGSGSVVLPHAVVNAGCHIGHACIINMGAIVDHGCTLEDGCHINSGAIVMAENHVPALTKVDSGEVIQPRTWQAERT